MRNASLNLPSHHIRLMRTMLAIVTIFNSLLNSYIFDGYSSLCDSVRSKYGLRLRPFLFIRRLSSSVLYYLSYVYVYSCGRSFYSQSAQRLLIVNSVRIPTKSIHSCSLGESRFFPLFCLCERDKTKRNKEIDRRNAMHIQCNCKLNPYGPQKSHTHSRTSDGEHFLSGLTLCRSTFFGVSVIRLSHRERSANSSPQQLFSNKILFNIQST